MRIRVGIPRALLYYHYFPLWRAFFEALGAEIVVSGPSTKAVLNRGVQLCVEDACLPVKLAFGHVWELLGKVDYLFLPRLVSVVNREYICPKFLGFPDMVRQTIPGLPPVIDVNVNQYRHRKGLFNAFREAGTYLTANVARIYLAYRQGLAALKSYRELLEGGLLPGEAMALPGRTGFRGQGPASGKQTLPEKDCAGRAGQNLPGQEQKPVVGVIGHPYNLYDSLISMNILKRLAQARVKVVTADQLPETVVRREAANLPKRLFWTLNQRITGAAFYFLQDSRVRGLLQITSFGCGPDSMIGELITRRARYVGAVPLLNLVLDEHSGEAGVLTRLEAFLDMVHGNSPLGERE